MSRRFIAIGVILAVAVPATAQSSRPLRDARSKNNRFELQVEPGRDRKSPESQCKATLFERAEGDKDARTERWSERLVNAVSPARAFVHDEGKYVVTVDDHRAGGAKHAVVIYDDHGKLKREFNLRELLRAGDWRSVRRRGKSIEWTRGARFAFIASPERFTIDLRSGRKITIDLEKGEVAASPDASADEAVPEEFAALLNGSSPDDAMSAESTDAQAFAELMRRLADGESLSPEEMAELAAGLAEFGLTTNPADPAEMVAQVEKQLAASGVEVSDEVQQQLAAIKADPSGWEDVGNYEAAGNSAEAGWAIPMPDPAKPVDYVAWLNEQVLRVGTEGSSAYRSALDEIVKWQGDEALMEAALKGDPAAIASPEISAWLDANAVAIKRIMDANKLEYAGMPVHSPDGSMIGILLPHAGEMRQAVRIMRMKGTQLEQAGDIAGAMEYFVEGARFGAQASNGPTLIENLVGQAMQAASSESILDTLASGGDSLDYTAIAQQIESGYAPARPISETFQAERTFMMDLIQSVYEFDAESETYRLAENGAGKLREIMSMTESNTGGAEVAAMALYLNTVGFETTVKRANEQYDRITDATMSAYPEGREKFQNIEASIASPMFRVTDPLLSIMLPAVSRASMVSTRSEAQRRATVLTANLRAYRQKNGAYPESLEALGERDYLVDPFSGQRFAYRRNGDDFSLYSLGANMSDEGGVHDPQKTNNDIVYWPRPPKQ